MSVSTDAAIEFFGTQKTETGTTATVADGAYSITGDIVQFTNTYDAPQAAVVAMLDWSVAPDANSSVNLYVRLINIDSTNDQDVPDANFQHVYVGSFPINDVTTNQYIAIDISLPNTASQQVYEFYIENQTGQTIQANWTLKVTPKTLGPHA